MRKLSIAVLLAGLALLLSPPAPGAGSALLPPPAQSTGGLVLAPDAQQGLDLLYAGQPEKALDIFGRHVTAQPQDPLGYLLEAEARWWLIYCQSCEIKFNLIDAWQRPRVPSDDSYLALTDKAVELAEASIAQQDSAVMELYAGVGLLLRSRLLALNDDRRGTARAGVRGRAHLIRCLQLDPQMADAYTGLGLYNYYVDTLSAIAKLLRVFMGIPGGKKEDGLRQLKMGVQDGALTRVEARFYLAKNLRNYDRDYAASIGALTPLTTQYPQNAVFALLLADTQAKDGHTDLAAAAFRTAQQIPVADSACAARVGELARQSLALLGPNSSSAAPKP